MVGPINRRKALATTAGMALGLTGLTGTFAASAATNAPPSEKDELEKLHQAALAEGGDLVVFAGGDSPSGSVTEDAFRTRFPGMKPKVIVDFSDCHAARINNQFDRNKLEPDVAHLQTLQNFPRWKQEDRLLNYKPLGWDQVFPQFKDSGGAFTAVYVVPFANVVNTSLVPEAQAPRDALDYLDPKYKGKLVFVYPNSDDAMLYLFNLRVQKYGWDYLDQLLAQDPVFVRGSNAVVDIVTRGDKIATLAGGGLTPTANSPVRLLLPKQDDFLAWPQTGAIFAKAKHPAAAKLYLSWLLSREFQDDPSGWSVRQDSPLPSGYKSIFDTTDPTAFGRFMSDRTTVERLRNKFDMYLGTPQGPSPTGVKGPFLL